MKRFLSLFIIFACMVNFTACGVIGNEPNIDEGLHIAANDAEQRLDRLKDEDNGPVVSNPPKDEQPSNVDSNPADSKPEDEDNPQNEPDDNDEHPIAPPLADVDPNGTDFTYDSGGRTYIDIDPESFWLDDDTFDLQGYVEACNAEILFTADDGSAAYEYEDPKLDEYETIVWFSIYVNSVQININTDAIGQAKANSLYAWDDDGLHYVEVLGVCEPWKECKFVNLVGFDQKIGSKTLEYFIVLFRRILNEDQGCQLRGLGLTHWSSYNSTHDD